MIVATVMRDAHLYLGTWCRQIESLAKETDLRVVVAEGDSEDATYKELLAVRDTWVDDIPLTVLKAEHGGPKFGSVDNPLRWRQMAAVCNIALLAAARCLEPDEPLIYAESDILWDAETFIKLAGHVTLFPAVAPMSMYKGRNYELWGLVKNGVPLPAYPPYFDGWSPDMMHQIDSQGSCFALSWTAAQVANFSPVDCIRGVGRSLRENGLSLWLDPMLSVEHP